jgi:hypothetical protein
MDKTSQLKGSLALTGEGWRGMKGWAYLERAS